MNHLHLECLFFPELMVLSSILDTLSTAPVLSTYTAYILNILYWAARKGGTQN